MRGVIVAIDLETTGLDYANDRIMEIGAVKFRDHEILETYTTLVDPEMNIPPKVTAITGIKQESLIGAPKIAAVLPGLISFVGDAPVLGHNIEFDLRFMNKVGALTQNQSLDTYELASVLLPAAPRYNLNALMQLLNLQPDGDYHRALADAQATAQVYLTLWDKLIKEVPFDLLEEITVAGQNLNWRGYLAFAAAYEERRATETASHRSERPRDTAPKYSPLEAKSPQTPLDVEMLISLLPPDKTEAIHTVSGAFNSNQGLLLEVNDDAILAYLLPAVNWSIQNGEHVVIATATSNLRTQLLEQHIPALQKMLQRPIHAVEMKSRADYLCPRRLEVMRRTMPTSIEELRVLAKVQIWREESGTDDCSLVSFRGPIEQNTWGRLTAQDELCTPDLCERRMNGSCPFCRASVEAQSANIIVVNQSLLLSDAMSSNPVLPGYSHLVIAEANKFEDSATYGLSFRLDVMTLKQQFANLGTVSTGLLGSVITQVKAAAPEKTAQQIENFVINLADAVDKMGYHADNLFKSIVGFLEATDNLNSQGDYLLQVRITPELREKRAFDPIQGTLSTLSQFTSGIAEALSKLSNRLATFEDKFEIAHLDDLVMGTEAAARHLTELYQQLDSFVVSPDSNTIYWIDIGQEIERMALRSAPLKIAPLIQQHLWANKKTVIMSSATLRVGGSFEYIRSRLGAAETVQESVVESPFLDAQPIMVYLPTDMPEPQDRNRYQQFVERGIIELAAAVDGRLLVVFTSFTQLRQATQNMAARLALGNITVFDQADGTSRGSLLEGFHATPRSVLLGTHTLWEGVDRPFDNLAGMVIVRLPFAVPSDPIVAARGELFKSSFDQFTIPDAVLRFRETVDQLLNARQSRSILAIFDKRLTSKQYGQVFLDSLPPHTPQQATMAEIGMAAKTWLTG